MSWEFPAWDPVLVDLFGPIQLRWYGLMYVVAFVCAQWIMTRLARARFVAIEPEKVGDLIFYLVLGVIVGGRAGYALFYDQRLLNPVEFLKVWEGGLAFHGGLMGVAVAFVIFARRNNLPILRVGDICALGTPTGVFAVRMANFINGELYGRVTTGSTFGAMRFPTDPEAVRAMGLADLELNKRQIEIATQYAYDKVDWQTVQEYLGDQATDSLKARLDWDVVQDFVPYRHPSQLYEGLGEGLLVGLVLLFVYRATRTRPLAPGAYGGIFLLGYGIVRFFIEFLRQPDAQFRDPDDPVGTVFLGMTMGQCLCIGMIVAGAWLLLRKGERGDSRGDGEGESTDSA